MKVAVLGNGLLGKEISKQSNWDNINRSTHQFDFIDVTSCYQYLINYDIIIKCSRPSKLRPVNIGSSI